MALDEILQNLRAQRAKPHDGIDRRTVGLSRQRPRSGLERRIDEALGLRARPNMPDIAASPPPDPGIDGPDIGW